MQDWPKVSAAVVTYNRKAFLAECLDSILAQQYPNLEIVVADDASTDGTPDLLREYEQKHPGLFRLVLADKNKGVSGNRNRALFACAGKYVAWIDDDDLMLPGRLVKQVEFLESHPDYVICYHDMELFDSVSGRTVGYMNSGKPCYIPREGGPEELLRYGPFAGGGSVMVRRSACPPKGFDERLRIGEDWLLLIETSLNGRIGYLPEVLSRYRRHGENASDNAERSSGSLVLAIVEDRYPQLAKHTRYARARLYYTRGVAEVMNRRGKNARIYLLLSLRQGWYSWKWFGWFLRAIVNN